MTAQRLNAVASGQGPAPVDLAASTEAPARLVRPPANGEGRRELPPARADRPSPEPAKERIAP